MRYILSCVVIGLILFVPRVHALIINEVMYDLEGTDTDREWIEVYNDTGESIDVSTYKFFESNSNHGLTPVSGGSTVSAGAYAIIADKTELFLQDWPNFSGILFDSSFSLTNETGETLALKDASGAVVDEVVYDPTIGASGDGNTLNRTGNSFVTGSATPGSVNQSVSPPPEGGSGSGSSSTSVNEILPPKKIIEKTDPRISTEVLVPTTIFAGMPVEIKTITRGYNNEPLIYGTFSFGYGDGGTLEIDSTSNPIFYTYTYPGEYVLTLEYRRNKYVPTVDASDRIIVNVVPLTAVVSVGTDGHSVSITNKTNFEMNIKGWSLVTENSTVIPLPKSLIVLPNKSVTISLPALGYNSILSGAVTLYDQSQKIISTTKQSVASVPVKTNRIQTPYVSTKKEETPTVVSVDSSALVAQVPSFETSSKNMRMWIIFGIFGLLVVAGAVSVYLIRLDKKESVLPGEDFEITE